MIAPSSLRSGDQSLLVVDLSMQVTVLPPYPPAFVHQVELACLALMADLNTNKGFVPVLFGIGPRLLYLGDYGSAQHSSL
jgi:hypothetical protein